MPPIQTPKRRPGTGTNRACLACRELATQLSLDRQFTRRGCAPFDRNGGPAGAGATGVQLYFGARVAYLALYAAGVFLLRSLVWNAATLGIALVLLSLV